MRHVDRDLDPSAPTLFELAGPSLGAMSVVGRGLRSRERIGRGVRFIARAARTHFSGNVDEWLGIDRFSASLVARRIRERQPRVAFAAFAAIDKASHASGHESPQVQEAMRIVDQAAAEIRHDAERAGRWETMHLWVVSDHGHSPVSEHDELAALMRSWGHATIAHPWTFTGGRDAAVMVSGNAMAHIYLELDRRERPVWRELAPRWSPVVEQLLARPSVDLLILVRDNETFIVRSRHRGDATIVVRDNTYSYRPDTGDPLGIGAHEALCDREAFDITAASDYPDALVQIARLAQAPRSGDIILSATRGWDFRARYEPIPHVSSHGALHREHMLVPLLTNRPLARVPRRTVDVMPSALAALGLAIPPGLDGESFVGDGSSHPREESRSSHLAPERPSDERGAEPAVA